MPIVQKLFSTPLLAAAGCRPFCAPSGRPQAHTAIARRNAGGAAIPHLMSSLLLSGIFIGKYLISPSYTLTAGWGDPLSARHPNTLCSSPAPIIAGGVGLFSPGIPCRGRLPPLLTG